MNRQRSLNDIRVWGCDSQISKQQVTWQQTTCTLPLSPALQINLDNFSADVARAYNMQFMITLCFDTHRSRKGNTWPDKTLICIMSKYFDNTYKTMSIYLEPPKLFYTKLALLCHALKNSATVLIQCREPWLRLMYCWQRLRVTELSDSWQNPDYVKTRKIFRLAH